MSITIVGLTVANSILKVVEEKRKTKQDNCQDQQKIKYCTKVQKCRYDPSTILNIKNEPTHSNNEGGDETAAKFGIVPIV